MENFLLLKSQKNEIFNVIQQSGIPPQEFEWKTVKGFYDSKILVSQLIHKSTLYYFQFDINQTYHFCIFSPGDSLPIENTFPGSVEIEMGYFFGWLDHLKREIEAPDLWEAIANEKVLSKVSDAPFENTQFTPEEITRIRASLDEIKNYLTSSQSFSPEQLNYLEERFNHLDDAATRMGRKDWITIVVGTLTNIIISLALTPPVARELLRIAGTVLSWMVGSHLLK